MEWDIDFITEEEFKEHVRGTILQYGKKLIPFDLKRFNKNIIDPVKLIFDKSVYNATWEEIIQAEIYRQRDKSTNNDIGYFHQNIFKYFENCETPGNGNKGGWDVIYRSPDGIDIDGAKIDTVYTEFKNKHNTLNSSSMKSTFGKMKDQLLLDDSCACYLVEAISKKSQNAKWTCGNESHKLIRKVSIDRFYELVTGDAEAFYKLCQKLPDTIDSVLSESPDALQPVDTVYDELSEKEYDSDKDLSISMAISLLGFGKYPGFIKK